jgi:hypothetical protein
MWMCVAGAEQIDCAERDASNQVHFDELNVQNLPQIIWPKNLVVARASVDPLGRGTSVTERRIAAMNSAIAKAEVAPGDCKELKMMPAGLEKDASKAKTLADADRTHELAAIFKP